MYLSEGWKYAKYSSFLEKPRWHQLIHVGEIDRTPSSVPCLPIFLDRRELDNRPGNPVCDNARRWDENTVPGSSREIIDRWISATTDRSTKRHKLFFRPIGRIICSAVASPRTKNAEIKLGIPLRLIGAHDLAIKPFLDPVRARITLAWTQLRVLIEIRDDEPILAAFGQVEVLELARCCPLSIRTSGKV